MAAIKSIPCPLCAKPRNPKNRRGVCRDCWRVREREQLRLARRPALSLERLDDRQRVLYDLIMLDRLWTEESQAEALAVIARASDYEAEALWWRAGVSEPVHQQSGTGLLQEYASV